MTYVEANPTFVHSIDTEESVPEAFTHEELAEMTQLFRMARPKLVQFATNFPVSDPESSVQTTFEKALKHWHQYHNIGYSREAWLYQILRNTALDEKRKAKRQPEELASDMYEYQIHPDPSADRDFDEMEAPNTMEYLLGHVATALFAGARTDSEKKKMAEWYDIFRLYAIENRKYEEISEALNIPLGTVRSRINRIRNRLAANAALCEALGKK